MALINVTVEQNTITVNETTDQVNVSTTQSNIVVSETAFVSNADIREAITVVDTGGDGSLSYNSNSGVLTYTGVSAAQTRAHFSNTSPIQYSSTTGVISIDENAIFSGKTTDDLAQGANNMYWSTQGNAVSTTYLTEGTNLYLNGAGTSDNLTEGSTNLFLTLPRWNNLFNNSIEGAGGSTAPISVTYTGGIDTSDFTAELDLRDGYVQRGTHNIGRGVGVYGQGDEGGNIGVSTGNVMLELQEIGLTWANASTQSVPVFRNGDGEARKRSWLSIQSEILESSQRYTSLKTYLSGNNNVVVNTAAANAIVVNNVNPGQGNIETVNGFFKGDGSLLTNLPQTLTNAQVVAHIATVPLSVGGNLTVSGNLEVTGNINYREVTDLLVQDQTITMNYGNATAQDAQIIVDRTGTGGGPNVDLKWNEATNIWQFTNDGTTYYPLPESTTDLAEGTNLYWTTARGNTNSDAWLTTKTTDNLTEGTNLYWSTDRGNATIGAYTGTIPQLRQTGNVLVLNDNQTTATDQYITVDYSNSGFFWSLGNPAIRFNRVDGTTGQWEVTNDGTTYNTIPVEGADFSVEHLSANTADIGHEIQQVYNGSGGSLSEGVAVYVAGVSNSLKANIATADSDVVAKMPAIGMIIESSGINNLATGNIITKGITDAIGFSVDETPGAPLYVNSIGGVTTNVPDDSNVRQQVGIVLNGTAGNGNSLVQLDFSMTEHETKNTKETTYYRKFYSNAAVTNYMASGTIGAITTGNVEIQEASVPDIYGSAGWGGGIDYIQLPFGAGYNLASGTRIRITGLPVIGANKEIGAYFNDTDWYVGAHSSEAYPLFRDPGLTLASRSGLGNFGTTFGNGTFNAFWSGTTPANITTEGFFEGALNGAVTIDVYNNTGVTLNKGEAVYLTGGNEGDNPHVALADNDDAAKMPALGLIRENINAGAVGQVVTSGVMNNAGHGYTAGADLYIDSAAGGITTTIPTGESKAIQKIGKVVSGNHILVQGAFRQNATPNLDSGNIFIGNGTNQAVTTRLIDLTSNIITTQNVSATTADAGANQFYGNTTWSNYGGSNADTVGLGATATAAYDYTVLPDGSKIQFSSGTGAINVLDGTTLYTRKATGAGLTSGSYYELFDDAGLTTPSQLGGSAESGSVSSVVTVAGVWTGSDAKLNTVGGFATISDLSFAGSVIGTNSTGNIYSKHNIESTDRLHAKNVTVATSGEFYAGGDQYTGGEFVIGIGYQIISAGTTDFTLIGAADNNPGTVFTATGVGTGTGIAGVDVGFGLQIAIGFGVIYDTPFIPDGTKFAFTGGTGNARTYLRNTTAYVKSAQNLVGNGGYYLLYSDEALTTPIAGGGITTGGVINCTFSSFTTTNEGGIWSNGNIEARGTIFSKDGISSNGNIEVAGGRFYKGDGSLLTNLPSGGISNADAKAYIESTGLSATANLNTTANASATYFLGNGSLLTGITAGGSTDSFGTILVAGETNIQATQANAQLTLAASGAITLTTAGNTVTIGGSGGTYGNAEVTNFLNSDTSVGNIAFTGDLTVGGPVANVNATVTNFFGSASNPPADQIQVSPDPVWTNSTPITMNSTTNTNITFLNGNTYYSKSVGGGFYELYTDSLLTTPQASGLGSESPSGLQAEYSSVGTSTATIEGPIFASGNVNTGATSYLNLGSGGIKAQDGGSIVMQSVRVTDFKANDPIATQGYANVSLPTASNFFAGSIAYDSTNNKPIYTDGTNWRYFSNDAIVT